MEESMGVDPAIGRESKSEAGDFVRIRNLVVLR
jgi:hypothetical protein